MTSSRTPGRWGWLYGIAALISSSAPAQAASDPTLAPPGLLEISPLMPARLAGSPLAFTATLGPRNVTPLAAWSSSDPSVASIDGSGHATLVRAGTTTIRAARLGHHASTLLTVTMASSPVFLTQPMDTSVNAVIDPAAGVLVRLQDNLGNPLPGLSVGMSLGTDPPGSALLSGTLTRATSAVGVATFDDLRLDWLGHGYTLMATASPTSGSVSAASAPFDELRVGDPCLGPELPACASACGDADDDGLNDAWEAAGGVDMNGDGVVTDAVHDLMLAGADPLQPDVYVQYDWFDYALPGNYCTTDADCATALGSNHAGETCTGPPINPAGTASCRYACGTDADCTSRGPGHSGEMCGSGSCLHTHDPDQTSPGALLAVKNSFAAHGIDLHLIRGHALPHSTVVSQRRLDQLNDACEGGSLGSGDAGPGRYADSFYDLKHTSSPDTANIAYHYTIFSHYSSCDSTLHCDACPLATNPDGSPKGSPSPGGQSGIAEISGNDFIVSFGHAAQDIGLDLGTGHIGGTFMHELGHNLGLHHGGGIDTPCHDDSDCHGIACTTTPVGQYCLWADDENWKPNYLSVMNYRYQSTGIGIADAVGSTQPLACATDADCPASYHCQASACFRLDYSHQTLPACGETPACLYESHTGGSPGLDEATGLCSGTADLFSFTDAQCDVPWRVAASDGPVDWNGDGDTLDTNVSADLSWGIGIDGSGHGQPCPGQLTSLCGHTDWPDSSGVSFTYKFQCTPYAGPGGDLVGDHLPLPMSP
jgi:hypothetical protein